MSTTGITRSRMLLEKPSDLRFLDGQIRAAHLPAPVLPRYAASSASAALSRNQRSAHKPSRRNGCSTPPTTTKARLDEIGA